VEILLLFQQQIVISQQQIIASLKVFPQPLALFAWWAAIFHSLL